VCLETSRVVPGLDYVAYRRGAMSFVENPIINSPFDKPQCHYELGDDGQPTGVKLGGRRVSIQVVPVPAARRRGPTQTELALFEEADGSRVTENALINEIRTYVDQWRELPPSQWGVTPETQRLLLHWREPSRARRLYAASIRNDEKAYCVVTMKSVSRPVSSLSALSETISAEPGASNSEMRSTASFGSSKRSSACAAVGACARLAARFVEPPNPLGEVGSKRCAGNPP